MVLTTAAKLADLVATVAPIDGVALRDEGDKSTWRIDFRPQATTSQRQAAAAVVEAFDPLAPENRPRERDLPAELEAASARLEELEALNRALLAKGTVTQAEIDVEKAKR